MSRAGSARRSEQTSRRSLTPVTPARIATALAVHRDRRAICVGTGHIAASAAGKASRLRTLVRTHCHSHADVTSRLGRSGCRCRVTRLGTDDEYGRIARRRDHQCSSYGQATSIGGQCRERSGRSHEGRLRRQDGNRRKEAREVQLLAWRLAERASTSCQAQDWRCLRQDAVEVSRIVAAIARNAKRSIEPNTARQPRRAFCSMSTSQCVVGRCRIRLSTFGIQHSRDCATLLARLRAQAALQRDHSAPAALPHIALACSRALACAAPPPSA